MIDNKKNQNEKPPVTFFEDAIQVFKPRPPNFFLYSAVAKNLQLFLYTFKFKKLDNSLGDKKKTFGYLKNLNLINLN